MRSESEIVGGESRPQSSDSFLGYGLHEAVWGALVGEDAIDGFLLLNFGLDVIERQ